tara:strand:+ start:535 stop:681 length:147 start_codon:yes stop_codon:yes gene_type:complete
MIRRRLKDMAASPHSWIVCLGEQNASRVPSFIMLISLISFPGHPGALE